ncbi:MAG: DUF2029 domain-containing protein, partial [Acidobacteriota bacterium]|nr:DUF2029 domain-containing protein [Acidobacteriota bacterium]
MNSETLAAPSDRLRGAFAVWAGWPLRRHVLAVALLALVAALRHWGAVTEREPLVDERFYLAAFQLAAEGQSPYAKSGFYYPPAFAYAGALLLRALGGGGLLGLLRGLNLLGLGFVVWLATAWLGTALCPRPWWRGLAAGAALVCLAPGVWLGLLLGNLSFLAMALMLGGLLAWRRRPGAAGLVLGASLALKPLAPVAILALFAHRPGMGGERTPGGRHRLAAGLALLGGVLLLVLPPGLDEMLAQPVEELTRARIVSLHRFLGHAGLALDPLWVAAAVALAAVLAVRAAGVLGPGQLLCVATAGAALATPLLWNHTLLMTLPLQGAAFHLARERLRAAPDAERRRRRYELALVLAAVAAILLVNGGGVDDRPRALQAPVVAV